MKIRHQLLPGLVALAFVLPAPARSAGDDSVDLLYERAVATAQEGRHWAAASQFEEVLAKMPTKHPLRTLGLYGAARANQKVGTPEAACRAVEQFRLFIGQPDAEPEKREKAANLLTDLIAKCNDKADATASLPSPAAAPLKAPKPAEPAGTGDGDGIAVSGPVASPVDRTWAWVATGAAGLGVATGGVLLLSAAGAVSDGSAAEKRFHTSRDTDAKARDDALAADDRASTYSLAGFGVLGVASALAGVATWLWLRGPEAPTAMLVPAPIGAGFVVRFQR